MVRIVVAYVVTFLVFIAIDSVWLTLTANALYRPTLGDMLVESFRVAPAILFYLVYIVGLTRFAVLPGLRQGWRKAPLDGAIFGFTAYATYDLTNQATLKNWTTLLTCADLAWGSLLSAVAATLATLIVGAITRSR